MQQVQLDKDNKALWPFPTNNGVRTQESQAMLDQKVHTKTKDDFSDFGEALM